MRLVPQVGLTSPNVEPLPPVRVAKHSPHIAEIFELGPKLIHNLRLTHKPCVLIWIGLFVQVLHCKCKRVTHLGTKHTRLRRMFPNARRNRQGKPSLGILVLQLWLPSLPLPQKPRVHIHFPFHDLAIVVQPILLEQHLS